MLPEGALHIALLAALLIPIYYAESRLRDHRWAFAAVEDNLVSSKNPAQLPVGSWVHMVSDRIRSEVSVAPRGGRPGAELVGRCRTPSSV